MTVLSVVQQASRKIGVAYPAQLFAGTTQVLGELQEAVNEAAKMIAFDTGHDWTKLKTLGTFTGDGVALGFNLPSDYKKMLKKARLWPSASPFAPYTHYPDTDTWLGTQVQSFQPLIGAWTIIGEQVQIRVGGNNAAVATGDTAQFYYISANVAKDSRGTPKAAFTADDDVFRLDERLLKLALIYKWKQAKNQDYAEEMSDYENALFQEIGTDKGSNILVVGTQRAPGDLNFAFPGTITP